jgi:hypothetical protein
MYETCWAHKKWNKIASDIKLIFYSSTMTMMDGPINIRVKKEPLIRFKFFREVIPCRPVNSFRRILIVSTSSDNNRIRLTGRWLTLGQMPSSWGTYIGSVCRRVCRIVKKTIRFLMCVTVHHRYNNINSQLDATIIILLITSISSTCFGR